MKKYRNDDGFSTVEVVSVLLVIIIIGTVGYYVFNHSKQKTSPSDASSSSVKTSAAPSGVTLTATANSYNGWNTYDDSAKLFTILYPQNWTIQTEASIGNNLESSTPILRPSNLNPAELSSGAGLYINPVTGSLNAEFQATVYGSGANYNPTDLTINGFPALYHQIVQTTADTGTTSDTKDYYAVANKGVTVLFSWTEQQGSYKDVRGFNLTSYNDTFRSIVESIKFTN